MNEPSTEDREDLRPAEYVLGVLDADALAALEREIERDPHTAAEVARWQRHLLPLAEEVMPAAPPDYVWERVRAALGFAATGSRMTAGPQRPSLWQNAALWRWFAIGASAVAAACIILLVIQTAPPAPPAAQARYMTARIEQDNGLPGWTVTMDPARKQLIVVPAAPQAIAVNRAPELWLIPSGGKPIAIGVFARDKTTTIALTPRLLARLQTTALLAVSIEPPGGSRTGQPTGPVIGKGAISET